MDKKSKIKKDLLKVLDYEPDMKEVLETAKSEIEEEAFRLAVDKKKEELRKKKSFWKRIFPWKIIIVKQV